MKRKFTVNGVRFEIADRNTNGMEINEINTRYAVMMFSEHYSAWTEIGKCNTIKDGYEFAKSHLNNE